MTLRNKQYLTQGDFYIWSNKFLFITFPFYSSRIPLSSKRANGALTKTYKDFPLFSRHVRINIPSRMRVNIAPIRICF